MLATSLCFSYFNYCFRIISFWSYAYNVEDFKKAIAKQNISHIKLAIELCLYFQGKRKANVTELDLDFDDDADTTLSKSDLAILESYNNKLKPLRDVSAPMADKEFRSKLGEHQSELTAFKADLKLKMKSLNRRVCNSEEIPPINEELGKIEELVKNMQVVIKCHWDLKHMAFRVLRAGSLWTL
jgi:hypothetical protein